MPPSRPSPPSESSASKYAAAAPWNWAPSRHLLHRSRQDLGIYGSTSDPDADGLGRKMASMSNPNADIFGEKKRQVRSNRLTESRGRTQGPIHMRTFWAKRPNFRPLVGVHSSHARALRSKGHVLASIHVKWGLSCLNVRSTVLTDGPEKWPTR
ncbi:hypothetical protein C8R45DRAFT_1184455, partial [Mycena sanguinolenta]